MEPLTIQVTNPTAYKTCKLNTRPCPHTLSLSPAMSSLWGSLLQITKVVFLNLESRLLAAPRSTSPPISAKDPTARMNDLLEVFFMIFTASQPHTFLSGTSRRYQEPPCTTTRTSKGLNWDQGENFIRGSGTYRHVLSLKQELRKWSQEPRSMASGTSSRTFGKLCCKEPHKNLLCPSQNFHFQLEGESMTSSRRAHAGTNQKRAYLVVSCSECGICADKKQR